MSLLRGKVVQCGASSETNSFLSGCSLSTLMSLWCLHLCRYHIMKPSLECGAALNQSAGHTWGAVGICGQWDNHRQLAQGHRASVWWPDSLSLTTYTKWKILNILPSDWLHATSLGTEEACCWSVKAICNWVGSKTSKTKKKGGGKRKR